MLGIWHSTQTQSSSLDTVAPWQKGSWVCTYTTTVPRKFVPAMAPVTTKLQFQTVEQHSVVPDRSETEMQHTP